MCNVSLRLCGGGISCFKSPLCYHSPRSMNSNDTIPNAFVALRTSDKAHELVGQRLNKNLHSAVSNFHTSGLEPNESGRNLFQSGFPNFSDHARIEERFP